MGFYSDKLDITLKQCDSVEAGNSLSENIPCAHRLPHKLERGFPSTSKRDRMLAHTSEHR